jgi:hypothetical protein
VASSCGVITAAAAPCMIRAVISWPGVWARPAQRLAAPKPAIPARNSRFRPRRSPTLPAVIRAAAKASM